jgi:hypothetical protein
MSLANLEAFVQRVQRDADLKSRAVEASSGSLSEAAVNVAELSVEVGLPFTPAEFEQAVQAPGFK